jgi:hypothetical protein
MINLKSYVPFYFINKLHVLGMPPRRHDSSGFHGVVVAAVIHSAFTASVRAPAGRSTSELAVRAYDAAAW